MKSEEFSTVFATFQIPTLSRLHLFDVASNRYWFPLLQGGNGETKIRNLQFGWVFE